MKTILWLYNHPLNPEAGGTERVTSLVQEGLTLMGHKCLGILVVDTTNGQFIYNGLKIYDAYSFLKDKAVDDIINQSGHSFTLLEFFLQHGGGKWKQEGGRIISCLHFNPKPLSVHYQFASKRRKSIHDWYVIVKTLLFYKYLETKDQKRVGVEYRKIYDNSDLYVILSNKFRDYMIKSMDLADNKNLIAIHNPLSFNSILSASEIEHKTNTILVVGRLLEWQKRTLLTIKIWEKIYRLPEMSNWDMKILGDGEDMDYYKSYITEHNIKRISLEGQQSPQKYYKEAKIFLLASKTEAWPMTILEAKQNGVVPIVFNTTPSFNEMIRDGIDGYIIKEGDLNEFKNAIIRLVTSDNLRSNMAKACLEDCEQYRLSEIIKSWGTII